MSFPLWGSKLLRRGGVVSALYSGQTRGDGNVAVEHLPGGGTTTTSSFLGATGLGSGKELKWKGGVALEPCCPLGTDPQVQWGLRSSSVSITAKIRPVRVLVTSASLQEVQCPLLQGHSCLVENTDESERDK